MGPGDQPTRGHSLRRRRPAVIVASLLAVAALTGCGDPDPRATGDVVTTGPEPGAEITPTPAPGETPARTTPQRGAGATKGDQPTRDGERAPQSANGDPTPNANATGPTPEPTIAPPATPKPYEKSDPFDLAFVRQMTSHQLAETLMAQVAQSRGQRAAVRSFAGRSGRTSSEALGKLAFWGDGLGLVPASGVEIQQMAADMRRLGVPVNRIVASRTLAKGEATPFSGVPDDAFDRTYVAAMIKHYEDALVIETSAIKTAGSSRFRVFADKLATRQRSALKTLRALRDSG